jgi:XTP/dITP diphosphohydrolase
VPAPGKPIQLKVASSNKGKLLEYRALAASASAPIEMSLISDFDALPQFEESAPTFGENAVGKALHYSLLAGGLVLADDSGLVVPALGGAPGVHSARYAGPEASDADRVEKVLREMRHMAGTGRRAQFVCVVALAEKGGCHGVFSASAEGVLLENARGDGGFGYDPIFYFPALRKTFAEMSREEKNHYSHRGIAFRKAVSHLES